MQTNIETFLNSFDVFSVCGVRADAVFVHESDQIRFGEETGRGGSTFDHLWGVKEFLDHQGFKVFTMNMNDHHLWITIRQVGCEAEQCPNLSDQLRIPFFSPISEL